MAEQAASLRQNPAAATSTRPAASLTEALLWTAKKLAYTFLPPVLLCLFVNLKGTYRFCTDGARRRRLTRQFGELLGARRSRAQLWRIALGSMQFRESRYLSRVVLPQRGPIEQLLEVDGLHHLDEAFAQGRGVLLLSAHIGYPVIIDLLLGRMNYKVRRLTNQPWEQADYFAERDLSRWPWLDYIQRHLLRSPALGDPIITSLNLRPIYGLLERNEALVVLADGLATSHLVTSRILEAPMPLSGSTLDLGRVGQVPVLPVFLIRERLSSPRLKLIIQEPLELQYSADREADIQVNADRYRSSSRGLRASFPPPL